MALNYGGIPDRGLPSGAWPTYGIPGSYGEAGRTIGYKHYIDHKRILRLKEEMEIIEILIILAKSGVLN